MIDQNLVDITNSENGEEVAETKPSKSPTKVTIDNKIERWKNMFNHLESEGIAKLLTDKGFNPKNIEEGKKLLNKLIASREHQQVTQNRKKTATMIVWKQKHEANATLSYHLELIKMILQNQPDLLSRIGAYEKREEGMTDWISQAKRFYKKFLGNKDVVKAFQNRDVNEKDLKAAQKAVEEVETARMEQLKLIDESKSATTEKEVAKENWEKWSKMYRKSFKHTLKDHPRVLVLLGID